VKALVTGARGFAGSWVAKRLVDSGAAVTSLDRGGEQPSGLELLGVAGAVHDVTGDLRDGDLILSLIREDSIDTVFHLAAQAIVGDANASPVPTFEANIQGTWVLLEACRQAEVGAVVVASSDKAYGPHDELPYTEDSALQPIYPYDVSKAATDLIARSYWHTHGLPVAVTRLANIYGGGDRNFSRLIPETVTAVLDGRRPVIRSDGSPERDFLYAEDAASAYLAIAEALAGGRGAGEAFNAGWGRPNPVREVVDLICQLGPGEIEADYRGAGNPSGEIERQYLDSAKIRTEIGWEPSMELREGLHRTLDWYAAHPEVRPAAAAT
jgi:CDP-glucose 4,6-dehydratase